MKYGINTIDDYEISNKTVLLRVDMNSPLTKDHSKFMDTTRIERCFPTIRELSERKAKLVVMTHQGSDVEYHNYYHTQLHAHRLTELLGKDVKYIDDVCGPAARESIMNLEPGEILLLDNVRFMAEEMTLFETTLNLSTEEQVKTQIINKLAPLADLYVCDAFAAAHRAQPTLLAFEQVLPSAMGRLFEKEYTILNDIVNNPQRPCVFILGGAKVQDAFLMMSTILQNNTADKILTGGLLGNIMLVASGTVLGQASISFLKDKNLWKYVNQAKKILEKYRKKILLPLDLAYISANQRHEIIVEQDLPLEDELIVDIGHKTIDRYKHEISDAATIFFNGPMGVFEEAASAQGTKTILETIACSKSFSVLGGGDSITAINKYELADKFSYICTGGGALIRFLSGEELPVVTALKKAAARNRAYQIEQRG